MNRSGLILLLLFGFMVPGAGNCFQSNTQVSATVCGFCGKPIRGEFIRYKNGPVYHRECHNIAERCKICGLPIGRNQKTKYDAAGHPFHSACYKTASFCVACGEPIIAGQSYRKAKNDGSKWHAACFENANFCGITGDYIRPGTATVKVGPELFKKTAYDQSKKCIVSALPLANHGRYIVNHRSKTFVLETYKDQTRQCYSCGDWLPDGVMIENHLFLCKYCSRKSVKDKQQADKQYKKALDFFRNEGIEFPENVEIVVLPPGHLINGQESADMKGACKTRVTNVAGLLFYKHTVEILYGLNPDRFATTLVHELSHAIIAENMQLTAKKEHRVPYEEGRCEFTAYRYAQKRKLPGYIIDGFASNRVAEYRDGFLHYANLNPTSLKSILTIK